MRRNATSEQNFIWAITLRCEVARMKHGVFRKWPDLFAIELEKTDTSFLEGPQSSLLPTLEGTYLELCWQNGDIDEINLCDMQQEVVGRSFDPAVETEPQVFEVASGGDFSIEGLEASYIPQGKVTSRNFKVLCKEIPDCEGGWKKVVVGLLYRSADGEEFAYELTEPKHNYDSNLCWDSDYYKFDGDVWSPIDVEDLVEDPEEPSKDKSKGEQAAALAPKRRKTMKSETTAKRADGKKKKTSVKKAAKPAVKKTSVKKAAKPAVKKAKVKKGAAKKTRNPASALYTCYCGEDLLKQFPGAPEGTKKSVVSWLEKKHGPVQPNGRADLMLCLAGHEDAEALDLANGKGVVVAKVGEFSPS